MPYIQGQARAHGWLEVQLTWPNRPIWSNKLKINLGPMLGSIPIRTVWPGLRFISSSCARLISSPSRSNAVFVLGLWASVWTLLSCGPTTLHWHGQILGQPQKRPCSEFWLGASGYVSWSGWRISPDDKRKSYPERTFLGGDINKRIVSSIVSTAF